MKQKAFLALRNCLCALLSFLLLVGLFACEALPGEKGEKGEQGVQGERGPQGETGAKGEQGVQGLQGEAGKDGSVVTVGENGNWYIDGVDTGIRAAGEQGERGEAGASGTRVEIGSNGNWFLDGVDSGVCATGGNAEGSSLAAATEKVKASTVTVTVRTESGSAIGSGFVYDGQGHICTNHHVIEDATFVQAILPDGTAREAQIVGFDAEADVAVLRVDAEGLVPAVLGNSELLSAGDRVLAVGTPTALSYIASATYGFVSAPSRLLLDKDADGNILKKMRVIQTDTPVNPGNSGGPLADAYGRIVGVVTMKLLTTQSGVDVENMGFALPINGVKQIADAIIADGAFVGDNPITRGRTLIGMSGYGVTEGKWYYLDPLTNQVTESDTQKLGYHYAEKTGVFVSSVTGENVLDKMQQGDIVMKVGGYSLAYTTDLIELVNLYEAGDTVNLTVWRDGAEIEIAVTLVEEELS